MATIHPQTDPDNPCDDSDATRLLPHHLEQLARGSGIAPQVAKARGYFSIDGPGGPAFLRTLGFSQHHMENTPGLLIPILDRNGRPVLYQYRPDAPRLDTRGEPVKYELPSKAGLRLDFGPGPHAWVVNSTMPLWITEGITQADALRTHGFHTIGLIGVRYWRDSNAAGGTIALADWEDVGLHGRAVRIVLDSDAAVTAEVRQPLAQLTSYLTHKGAEVTVVSLPAGGHGKVGIDDYLLTHTVQDLDALVGTQAATEGHGHAAAPGGHEPSGLPTPGHDVQSTRLIAMGRDGELFRTPEGQPYACVRIAGHREVMAIGERGSSFRAWLAGRFYAETGRAPSNEALSQAIGVLRGKALFEGGVHDVHTRFARHGQALYLDLANEAHEVVELTGDGWRVMNEPPVYFRRPGAMRALPRPDRSGTMADLHQLLTVPAGSEAELLIDGWLVHVLMPNGPYSPLCIHGEQGSAKSTLTKMLRQLLDPNQAPSRRPPKDERDLAIMALHSPIVVLENLSHLPDWLSDALCCLATGSGLSTRKLYADDDEVVFAATRPVILNGIAEVAVRGDLIDRCTFVTLPPFQKHEVRDERALWAAFDAAHPRILGALLNAACAALKHRPTTHITALPRMADYARWVEAAAPALGWAPEAWLTAYEGNRDAAVVTALEASPVTTALMTYLDAHEPVERILMGTLLTALTDHISGDDRRPLPPTWPRSPQALSTALKQLAPALRSQGIDVTMHRHTKRGTPVSLTWVARKGSEPALGDEGDDDYPLASVEVRKRPLSLPKPRQGIGASGQGGKTLSPSSPPRTLPGHRLQEVRHAGDMASPGRELDVAQDVRLEHRRAIRHPRTFVRDLIDLCVLCVPVGSCPWCGSWGQMVRCRGTFICPDCLQEGNVGKFSRRADG